MTDVRVLHLAGSPESDFWCDLSRLYAAGALDVVGGEVAYVTPDGAWRFPVGLDAAAVEAAPPHAPHAAIGHLLSLAPDVVVPQMFCRAGMTHYRALLDVLGIPYLGNAPDVMALGADKAWSRAVVSAAGVAVPAGIVAAPDVTVAVGGGGVTADGAASVAVRLPAVIKPVAADNSAGVTLVREPAELAPALEAAWDHGDALVEQFVAPGREVRCGTLERDGELVVLPLEEYPVGADRPVRTADDKLAGSGDDLRLVAKGDEHAWIVAADDPVNEAVGQAARLAHRALGCRHYGLFDFRVDDDGVPWFLEAGLYCSFSSASVLATMARAAGIGTGELFEICAQEALR